MGIPRTRTRTIKIRIRRNELMAITITDAGEIVCDCGERADAGVWHAGVEETSYDWLEDDNRGEPEKAAARLIEVGVKMLIERGFDYPIRHSPRHGTDHSADMEEIALGIITSVIVDKTNSVIDRQISASKSGARAGRRLV